MDLNKPDSEPPCVLTFTVSLNLGSPPTVDVDITSLHAKNPKDLWKKVYERVFPTEVVHSLGSPSPLSALQNTAFFVSEVFVKSLCSF